MRNLVNENTDLEALICHIVIKWEKDFYSNFTTNSGNLKYGFRISIRNQFEQVSFWK